MSDLQRRLDRLSIISGPPVCRTCLGRPHRVLTIDGDTDDVVSETMPGTMPGTGCPACGASVYREYVVVIAEGRGA